MSLRGMLSDNAKVRIRQALGMLGVEIGAYAGSFAEHRAHLLKVGAVATVWDVGAHVGQYGAHVRGNRFRGKIISIEPSSEAHRQLLRRARRDHDWHVLSFAVSDSSGDRTLYVAANGQSSSLLPIKDLHTGAAPDSRYVATQRVPIATLDSLHAGLQPPAPFYVKLDVQGGELAALRGASLVLQETIACEVELSFADLYEGGSSWLDVMAHLTAHGFALCDVERVFFDPATKDLLQVNGLFRRTATPPRLA
jgi:FkbM family methyltransferase